MHTAASQPRRVAQYEIVELLASAGKARAYRAVDTTSRQDVTLKTIVRDPSDRDAAAAIVQLQKQARLSVGLKHSGIVEVFEYGVEGDLAYLASEFVEGCRLKPLLRVPVADAGSLIVQLLDALDYAHTQGVVHLELRPSNLLLTSKGQLRIADFGVSAEPRSPAYQSPEQIAGATVDRRSDIFAAGVMFYEWATGLSPFPGPADELARQVCSMKELPPSQANPRVQSAFDPVCGRSLAKSPSERYSTARDFCDDVRAAFEDCFGAPPAELVSNETAVSMFLSSLRGDSRKSRSSPAGPKPVPKAPAPVPESNWPSETLRTIERQLAFYIGPLARVVVKEAAARTSDLTQLYVLAAESLASPDERRGFLGAHGAVQAAIACVPSRDVEISSSEATTAMLDSISAPEQHGLQPGPFTSAKAAHKPESRAVFNTGPVGADSRSRFESMEVLSTQNVKPEGLAQKPSGPVESDVDIVSRLDELLGKQPENLSGYLAEQPPEVDQVIYAFVSALEALIALYAANSKTGGLAPQSISFDRMGKARIRAASLTSTGGTTMGAMGSPRYAAPENFEERKEGEPGAAATADIYALGFMFYEILLGRTLFRQTFAHQRTDLEWLRWHADFKAKAPSLKSLLPERPAALSELVEAMMEKDTSSRASDPAAILARLRIIAQQSNRTIVVRKNPAPTQAPEVLKSEAVDNNGNSKRWLRVLVVLLILGIIGLVLSQNPSFWQKFISPQSAPADSPTNPGTGNQ